MSYVVPLYSKDPTEGKITYLSSHESLEASDGFFSFTFYIRDKVLGESTSKGSDIYLKGLNYYRSILGKGPFTNWKMLIYTDAFTYAEILKTQTIDIESITSSAKRDDMINFKTYTKQLLDDSRIIFAVVDWPRHQRRKTRPQINGSTLRPLRSRAPFDFPTKYIFIRDADTFFETKLKRLNFGGLYVTKDGEYNEKRHDAAKQRFSDTLLEWERIFFEKISDIKDIVKNDSVLIVGVGRAGFYDPVYLRSWHSNELLGKTAPFGVFAGFINVTPGVPIYQNYKVWDDFIEYIDNRSILNETNPHTMLEKLFKTDRGLKIKEKFEPANLNLYKEKTLARYVNKEKGSHYIQSLEDNIFYDFSNNEKEQQIGRDEQLYLFLILPNAMDNVYFHYMELDDMSFPELNIDYHIKTKAEFNKAIERDFRPMNKTLSNTLNEEAKSGWGGKRTKRTKRTKRSKKVRKNKTKKRM